MDENLIRIVATSVNAMINITEYAICIVSRLMHIIAGGIVIILPALYF